MAILVHLSDLHFGRVDNEVINSLKKSIRQIKPNITIISGDLTQRAKEKEFLDAKKFINGLKHEVLVIPGNHDVPLFNLWRRFFSPFERYKKYIHHDLEPFYQDQNLAILGINTARPFRLKHGRISAHQAELIQNRLTKKRGLVKILVGHHPFDLPDKYGRVKIISGAKGVMQQIVDSGVDLVLGGHMHISYIGSTARRYKFKGKDAIVLQAATVSKRTRGEEPSFNVIKISKDKIHLERMVYNQVTKTFDPMFPETFLCVDGFWVSTTK